MKVRFDKIGYPLYCDAGQHEGDMRINLTIRQYLSPEEYARYEGSESLQITLSKNGSERLQPGSAAEPSGDLPAGGIVAAGEAKLAAGRVGWTLVPGGLEEARSSEYGTAPSRTSTRTLAHPGDQARYPRKGARPAMTALESPHYQIARDWIEGNPVIAKMAAGVATVPLAELAHEDGTPRFAFMQQANRAFDQAEAMSAGNPCYRPYPADAPRHLGLIAEAVLAERAAIREAVSSAMAPPGTDPESSDVTAIIERLRAGDSPVAIARQTGGSGDLHSRTHGDAVRKELLP